MRAHQFLEKDIMLKMIAEVRKNGSPVCNGWTLSK
jgi:hypothetical protein